MNFLIRLPAKKKIEAYDFGTRPHIGLAYLAAYLSSKKIEVKIFDAKSDLFTTNHILKQIGNIQPSLIGLTAMTHEIEYTAEFAEIIKKQFPHIKIIIGGVHATLMSLETMEQFSVFDFLIYGEGEISLFELINSLNNNLPLNRIKGLIYREGSKIIQNEPRELISNLDELPFPAWYLFKKKKNYPVSTSRGCPFQCIFCTRVLGNRIRNRSINNVIKEIEYLIENFNISSFVFIDDTFAVSQKRVLLLLDQIIERKINKKVSWIIQTRVDCVNMSFLVKLKKSGCTHIDFGIESGNDKILKIIKKNITKKQAIKAVYMAKKVGLGVSTFFIIGHPFETKKTIMQTISLAIKLNSDKVAFGIMTPYPKTEIYNMALNRKGGLKLISKDWRDFNKNLGNALELEKISRKWLEFYQLLAFFLFYFFNYRIIDLFLLFKKNKIHFFTILKKLIGFRF